MRHSPPAADQYYDDEYADDATPPMTAARVIRVLRSYLPAIALATLAVTLGYAILATVAYLTAPSQKVMSQPFRLDFRGASEGQYPNGVKFSPADIVSAPILLRVYRENQLEKFIAFPVFSRSLFVLEYNAAYQRLASEYQVRLADPKLSPVDRDRLASEFEAKRASLAKNEYALHFLRSRQTADIPDRVVRHILVDILNKWAHRAVHEQHVLLYRVAVLSPQVVDPTPLEQNDVVAAIHVLRAKVARVLSGLADLSKLPGAELARAGSDRMSLAEIRLRLEDINRFRLEPLVPLLRTTGVENPAASRQFLESQLALDRRQLDALRTHVEAIRQTLAAYAMAPAALADATREPQTTTKPPADATQGQNVVPQISDTFIDRIVALANNTADLEYRQELANDLRTAAEAVAPAAQAVAYDEEMLRLLATATVASPSDRAAIRAQIESTRSEVRNLIQQVNTLHRTLSENVNPPTELFSLVGVPITTADRGVDVTRLLAYGLLAILGTIVLAALLSLLHNFVVEQQASRPEAAPAPEALT
jgi:hypothetical protein